MPDFPRANSERSLTTQQPLALRNDADVRDEASGKARVAGAAVDSLSKNVMDWNAAVETIQKDTALFNYKTGLQKISNDAVLDKDITAESKYQKQIQDLKKDVLGGVESNNLKARMASELNYMETVGAIGIQTEFRKKTVVHGQAIAISNLELLSQAPGSEKAIKESIKSAETNGYWNEITSGKLERKYLGIMRMNEFTQDYNNSVKLAGERVASNYYKFSSMQEREAAQTILEKESKKVQMRNENNLLTAYLNKEDIDPTNVTEMMNKQNITPKFAESFVKKLENPMPDRISRDTEFIMLQNKSMALMNKGSKATTADILTHMAEVMQAHASGVLDKTDVNRMIKELNPVMDDQFEKLSDEAMAKANPKTWQEHISFWSDEYAQDRPEIKARMYRRMLDAAIAGKDLNNELTNVMDDEITLQLAENKAAPDRQFGTNPDTNQRIYSDDGGSTWFDEKTKKEIK